jgi:N-acetylmuramoyl-L-alanine amidase
VTVPLTHVVRQGECMTQIARRHGFADFTVVYDHPDNAELRKRRPNPHVLRPGDEVAIPDRELKSVPCATCKTHRFVAKRPTRALRVELQDASGEPIAGAPFRLAAGGWAQTGKTSATGLVEAKIPIELSELRLELGRLVRVLHVGHLDPLRETDDDGVPGVQARLANLGWNPGPVDGVVGPRTRRAIRAFQRSCGLRPTGSIDDALLAKLEAEHGC